MTNPRWRCLRLAELGLDPVLGVVGQLEPVCGEQLDPVVLVWVVRGRDHRRQLEPVAAHEQRSGRRRQDPAEQCVTARGCDTGGDRRLEHLARLARVADDQHLRPV